MKKSFVKLGLCAAFALFAVATATAQKKAWSEVKKPEITKIALVDGNTISVEFNLLTSNDGSDKGSVVMSGSGSTETAAVGKTRKEAKKVEFTPKGSGLYTFTVYGERNGEKTKIQSEPKTFQFSLPLTKPTLSALNIGNTQVEVKWNSVKEADGYVLSYTKDGKKIDMPQIKDLQTIITDVPAGAYSDITVTAVRGKDRMASETMHKLVRAEKERVWKFTEFGTSTNPARNNYEVLDPNNLKVRVNSCTFDPKTGNILEKGGKFESYFDGISFYYTVIDPEKENFELTATVHIDYMNPMADGQEGFGVLALDKLGIDGEPMVVAYSNSAGVISRKFTTHVNGAKKEIKDGVGARFVYDITPEILAMGDAGLSQYSTSLSQAFSYDQGSDAVRTGDTYRVTLKKDNTGYHAIYKRDIVSEDAVTEYILYDTDNMKLRVLDKDHVYLGFATARGVNATFSDVELKITDPKKDPPAEKEPPILIPLNTTIQSPTTWYNNKYPFVFTANSNGKITVETTEGKKLIKGDKVKADVDYKKTLKITKDSITDLIITFDPDDGYEPTAKKVEGNLGNISKKTYAIGQYNTELLVYEKNYKPVSINHSIISKSYAGKELFVATTGDAFGNGSKEAPLDLQSAINYSAPGQTITILPGTYYPKSSISIERGNDGTAKARKVLRSQPGTRAIINLSSFKTAGAGFELYGNYWTIEDIDLTRSQDDSKAMQIAGSYNIVRRVDAYMNADTGIQVSGRSAEPYERWPSYNLIEGCEAFGNSDPAMNNADGFGCKLTVADGNVFRNCVAHHNVDDGWDLYSKVESGPIGVVIIENCIAYNNGRKIDNSGKGDGNGFKLGGDGIAIPHRLINSVSFNNDLNGVTTNSNPALIVENCTLYANKECNLNLYGKGDVEQYPRTASAKGVLSINGGGMDKFDDAKDPTLRQRVTTDDNFIYNGALSQNKSGTKLDKSAFVSADFSKYDMGINPDGSFNRIPRNANGEFDLGDLFKLTDKVPAGVGAHYNNRTIDAK